LEKGNVFFFVGEAVCGWSFFFLRNASSDIAIMRRTKKIKADSPIVNRGVDGCFGVGEGVVVGLGLGGGVGVELVVV